MKKGNLLYMILGIGLGITLTSIAMMVSPVVQVRDYTDEEIRQAAKDLGYGDMKDLIEANTGLKKELETAKESAAKNKAEVDKLNENIKTISAEFTELKTLVEESTNANKPSVEANSAKENTAVVETTTENSEASNYTLVIKKGDSSQDVTDELYDMGIIDDKQEFMDTFYKLKATTKIQYGKFDVTKGMTNKAIITSITK